MSMKLADVKTKADAILAIEQAIERDGKCVHNLIGMILRYSDKIIGIEACNEIIEELNLSTYGISKERVRS